MRPSVADRQGHIGVWAGPSRAGQVVLRGLAAGSASLADSLYRQYQKSLGRQNGSLHDGHVVLSEEQTEYFVQRLESAAPLNEELRSQRQRELFDNAATVELHSPPSVERNKPRQRT